MTPASSRAHPVVNSSTAMASWTSPAASFSNFPCSRAIAYASSPSLPYGRWTAWWPESDSHDRLTGTLTLKDGTTRPLKGN